MLRAFEDWNRCLKFESPSLTDLITVSGWPAPKLVFPHSHLLWLVGPNLAAQLDAMHAPPGHIEGPVKRVTLVLTSTYFAATAIVTTEDLPPFRMLQRSFPCTAEDLRAHLKQLGGPIELFTEATRIRMVFDGRTEFCFEPSVGNAIQSLAETRLVTIENIYRSWMVGRPALVTDRIGSRDSAAS